MKKLALMGLALAAFGLQAQSDQPTQFSTWDTDQDGYINDEEFETSWNKQESYSQWDADMDGTLNEDEWQTGIDSRYTQTDNWDQNKNNNYSVWDGDSDGILTENELRMGSYNTWDSDGDGRISESEYGHFNSGTGMKDSQSNMKKKK